MGIPEVPVGMLVDGKWTDAWYDTSATGGRFVRTTASFRSWTRPGGDHPPEPGRYHLVVAAACPWCHRVSLARALFGLERAISVTHVSPWMLDQGWVFEAGDPDPILGASAVHELYTRADPTYTGRVTVPILWDRERGTIVSNESSEIIRMLDDDWRPLHTREAPRWFPEAHRDAIEAVNAWVYTSINNGVYRCGFATTQAAYDEAVTELFDALERAERMLDGRAFLVADHPTEADWRLWVTLIRFDLVYHGHFKCNVRRIADMPNLHRFLVRLHRTPGVAETVDLQSIKTHYYGSHESINPHRIVPRGPTPEV